MPELPYSLLTHESFTYIEDGREAGIPPILLLHGMLGDVGNWASTVRALASDGYHAIAPVLPVYDLPLRQTSVSGLVAYVREFVEALGLQSPVLVGNSLGGHIALLYALAYPDDVPALVLSGASGIYEVSIGTTTPRRQDREYIRERAAFTFYDPQHATDELVEEMYEIVNDRGRAMRLIKMARATKAEALTDRLPHVSAPTLLVWGRDDQITPPDVAQEFEARLPNARLAFIDACGHAPMIEHPDQFNERTLHFLSTVLDRSVASTTD